MDLGGLVLRGIDRWTASSEVRASRSILQDPFCVTTRRVFKQAKLVNRHTYTISCCLYGPL